MPDRTSKRLRTALALIVALYFALCCVRPEWMGTMGIAALGRWFIDTFAVLAASDAHAMGIAPQQHNPLDLFNQPHLYSDWWFALHHVGLTRDDYVWIGATIVLGFMIVALLQLRARSVGELFWSIAIMCSPPVVFAFNRANVDLVIFMFLSALVPCLLARRAAVRWCALVLILSATGMKFYPALAGLMLLAPTRPRREIIAQLAVMLFLLGAFTVSEWGSITRYWSAPRPTGFFTFGIGLVPAMFGLHAVWTNLLRLAFGAAAILYWWRTDQPAVADAERGDYLRFMLGAIVVVSSYFLTINYLYRLVCVIWMAPFLWAAWSSPVLLTRLLARTGSVLAVSMAWFDSVNCVYINLSHVLSADLVDRWTDRLLLAEQPLVATFIFVLLGFVVPFIRDGVKALFFNRSTERARRDGVGITA